MVIVLVVALMRQFSCLRLVWICAYIVFERKRCIEICVITSCEAKECRCINFALPGAAHRPPPISIRVVARRKRENQENRERREEREKREKRCAQPLRASVSRGGWGSEPPFALRSTIGMAWRSLSAFGSVPARRARARQRQTLAESVEPVRSTRHSGSRTAPLLAARMA